VMSAECRPFLRKRRSSLARSFSFGFFGGAAGAGQCTLGFRE
jgi:hypothetical protein